MSVPNEKPVNKMKWIGSGGVVVRTGMLMTNSHEWTKDMAKAAEKTWRDLHAKATEAVDHPVPREIVDGIERMDTVRVVQHMMEYGRTNRGKDLWAAMEFVGLLPQPGEKTP